VIDSSYKSGVKKLLNLGSSCIYPKLSPQPIKEEYLLTSELEPTNEWYAVAKIAGIKMCQAYSRQYGFNAISLMPTNLYGPNDNFDLQTSHVLPAMLRKFHLAKLALETDLDGIAADEMCYGKIPEDLLQQYGLSRDGDCINKNDKHKTKVVLWGTGKPRREFIHVEDIASACVYLMNNYDKPEIINIGVGEDIEIRELAKIVCNVVGYEGEVYWDNTKPDGTPRKLLDITKLNSTGWKAKINLVEGIESFYNWYLKNRK